jgi:transcriptional activator HAC1
LMQSSLTCRVPLAQLMLATRLSQRSSSVETVDKRPAKGTSRAGPVDGAVVRSRLMKSSRRRPVGRRRHVTPLKRGFGSLTESSRGWENMANGVRSD